MWVPVGTPGPDPEREGGLVMVKEEKNSYFQWPGGFWLVLYQSRAVTATIRAEEEHSLIASRTNYQQALGKLNLSIPLPPQTAAGFRGIAGNILSSRALLRTHNNLDI